MFPAIKYFAIDLKTSLSTLQGRLPPIFQPIPMFFVFLGTLLAYLLVVVPTGRFITSKISFLYLKTTVTQQSFIEESATFSR